MVDQAAEPNAGKRSGHQVDAGDPPGREDRSSLQEDIEGDREPNGEIDQRDEQRIDQQREKGLHVAGVQPQPGLTRAIPPAGIAFLGHRVLCTGLL